MPCYEVYRIEVTDEAAARDALRALGLPDSYLSKVGGKWEVVGLDSRRERQFQQQYARSYTQRAAKKKYFHLTEEETLSDGSIRMRFES